MTEECKFKTSIPKAQWHVSWKRLYAHLSGGQGLVQKDILEQELTKYKTHLLEGFNTFKHISNEIQSAQSSWALLTNDKPIERKKKKLNESHLIVSKFSNITDLEEETCEKILVNYFENKFVGTKDDVDELLANTNKQDELLDELVFYYIHERSFMIKCWKIILTCVFDEDHLYHEICKKYVQNQNPNTLYDFFIKQLESVHSNSSSIESHTNAELLKTWINHTLSSHVDILCCLIYCSELRTSAGFKDVKCVLSLCKSTSFGNNFLNYRFAKSTFAHDWTTYIGYTYCLHLMQVILDINFDWTFAEFNEIFEQIKTLDVDQHPVLVPVVYLVWMLFLVRINYINDEEKMIKYSQEVLQRTPWKNLHLILTSDVVTIDKTFESLVKTKIKGLVCETIKYFDTTVLEHECEDVFKLLAHLEDSNLDEIKFEQEIGKLVEYGLDMFPGKYAAVLDLFVPLMNENKSNCSKLLSNLLSVKYFNWKSVDVPMENRDDAFFNSVNFCPFEFVQDVLIPKGTECRQSDSGFDYFQWNINISLWHIIKEELSAYCVALTSPSEDEPLGNSSYLCNSAHGKAPHQKYLLPSLHESQGICDKAFRSRVISYMKLISVVVKYPHLLDSNIQDILGIVSRMFEINVSLNALTCDPDLEIVSLCVEIAKNMYPGVTILYNQVEDIFPAILPTPDVANAYEILSTGRFLKGNFLKRMLTNVEMRKDKYDFVLSYLNLIKKLGDFEHAVDKQMYKSGILFVALELFPACLNSWVFVHEKQRREICSLCLELMYDFINSFSDIKSDSCSDGNMKLPSHSAVAKSLVYSILEGECGLLLLEITSLGDTFLLNSFQETPSSCPTTFPKLIDMVYYSIAILNKVFYLKHELKEFENIKQYSLESNMFREQDKNRFIKNIISYIHHVLNKNLRILSIKLLARIAENKEISLTVGSGLNSDIVRSLWLQPLFSPTETPQFKIALFQFAVQCLQTQATLACSLLNIENLDEKSNSLLKCVLDYLKTVNDVNDPLHYWILAVVHTVWKTELFIARNVLINDKDFWKCLCAPLTQPPCSVNNNVYSPVFNIISTELFWMHDEKDHPLFDFVNKFFQNDSNLKLWSKASTSVELSKNKNFGLFHQLTISWQEFIVVVCKFRKEACSKTAKNLILLDVLDALVEHLDCMTDDSDLKKSFHCLCNLGLIILNYWDKDCTDSLEEKLYIACNIIMLLALKYEKIPLRTQIFLLAVVSKLFNIIFDTPNEKLSSLVQENTMFLKSLSLILIHSLDIYENILSKKDIKNPTTQLISVIIPLTIKVQTVVAKDNLFWINTLLGENIIFKIYQCIVQSIKIKYYNTTSSFLLEYLIHCVLGNNYFKFLDKTTLVSIIEDMTPESNIHVHDKNYTYLKNSNINYVYTNEDYNLFYNKFINLLIILFNKGDVNLKAHVFNFIIINYESIICLFKYCGLTLVKNNLTLVLSILNLLLEVSNHRILIQDNTKQYFVQIIQNLSVCIGTTIQLIESDELKIAHTIYPKEAFTEGLHSKLYNYSKFKTDKQKTDYCNEIRMLLINIFKACITIYNKFNVDFGNVFTCVRLGYRPWSSHLIVPYVPIEKRLELDIVPFRDFTIILKCLKVHIKLIPKYTNNQTILTNLKTSLEMALHLLINHSLIYLLNPCICMKDKHVLLRDIDVNLTYVVDYIKKNNGSTPFPLTKHWTKSPSKYYNFSKMKIPHIKLRQEKINNALTWEEDKRTNRGNKTWEEDKRTNRSVKRIVFDSNAQDNAETHAICFDMDYMQFMGQLLSQICSSASNTI